MRAYIDNPLIQSLGLLGVFVASCTLDFASMCPLVGRSVARSVISILHLFCSAGSPGFDSESKLAMMYCKGFGRLETAVSMATIRESMASQADGNDARQTLINAILPNAWNG